MGVWGQKVGRPGCREVGRGLAVLSHLISRVAEFASCVEYREHCLERRSSGLGVCVAWDAPPIIGHRHTPVPAQDHVDARRVTRKDLIDTIVDDFKDEMVEASRTSGPDVHARAFAHWLEAFEHRDLLRAVARVRARDEQRVGRRRVGVGGASGRRQPRVAAGGEAVRVGEGGSGGALVGRRRRPLPQRPRAPRQHEHQQATAHGRHQDWSESSRVQYPEVETMVRYFLAHQQINAINPRCVRRDGWPAERGEMWRAVGLCVAFLPLAAPAAPAAALLLGSQLSAATTAAVASALATAAAAATSASGASVGRSASELATSFASLASDLAAAASRTARSSLGAAVHRCLLSHSPIFRFCHSPCFLYNQRHLV